MKSVQNYIIEFVSCIYRSLLDGSKLLQHTPTNIHSYPYMYKHMYSYTYNFSRSIAKTF